MTTICPKCGKSVRAGAKFCGNCRTQITPVPAPASPPPVVASAVPASAAGAACPHCGKPVRPGAAFCPSCGKKIESHVSAQPANPLPTSRQPAQPVPVGGNLPTPPKQPRPPMPTQALTNQSSGQKPQPSLMDRLRALPRLVAIGIAGALILCCAVPVVGYGMAVLNVTPTATLTATSAASETPVTTPPASEPTPTSETISELPSEIPPSPTTPSNTPTSALATAAEAPTETPIPEILPSDTPMPTDTPSTPALVSVFNETFDNDDWTTRWIELQDDENYFLGSVNGYPMTFLALDGLEKEQPFSVMSENEFPVIPGSIIRFSIGLRKPGRPHVVIFNLDPNVVDRPEDTTSGLIQIAVGNGQQKFQFQIAPQSFRSCESPLNNLDFHNYEIRIGDGLTVAFSVDGNEICASGDKLIDGVDSAHLSFSGVGRVDNVEVIAPQP